MDYNAIIRETLKSTTDRARLVEAVSVEVERRSNAYPRLVEALQKLLQHRDGQIVHRASLERAEALLRELGEDA